MSEPTQPVALDVDGFIAGMPDDHEVPWALQIVVRQEKGEDQPSHLEVCECVARAVVTLLASPQAGDQWREQIAIWRDARIRKLVRRARGKRWDEVQTLPGVTVTQGLAQARAIVPGPVHLLPKALDKLQVADTNFPDGGPSTSSGAVVAVGISPLIGISTGKAAAQGAHAAQLAWEGMDEPTRVRWSADEFRVRVFVADKAQWGVAAGRIQVVDAGFTELDGPTETTRAWW